jgi:glyoxylase-like metal-dependent hydrolase (beta-lactamase superfamily II)
VAEAEALAAWVALHNRNLETIYITHADFDHFYGLSVLLDRFPGRSLMIDYQIFLSRPLR